MLIGEEWLNLLSYQKQVYQDNFVLRCKNAGKKYFSITSFLYIKTNFLVSHRSTFVCSSYWIFISSPIGIRYSCLSLLPRLTPEVFCSPHLSTETGWQGVLYMYIYIYIYICIYFMSAYSKWQEGPSTFPFRSATSLKLIRCDKIDKTWKSESFQ